jgi:hypothetical protein
VPQDFPVIRAVGCIAACQPAWGLAKKSVKFQSSAFKLLIYQ